MPNRRIERGVKLAGVKLYEHGVLPLSTILDVLGYSRRTFFRTLKLWRETGDVVAAPSLIRGRLRLLNYDDISYLLLLINQNPDYFLDELLDLLETNRFISVHYTTIHRALERAGVSCKKLRRIAIERNVLRRADYVHQMSQYLPEYLGFLDETSKDERTLTRGYGRSKRSQRAAKKAPFKRGRRTYTEALLSLDGIVACKVVEGSMTKLLFLEWLEFNVLPKCNAYPGPLSVLVMDNAKIHHGPDVTELCERFGVRVEYLPPYSPDFQPIEEAFSKIKAFLRRHRTYYSQTTGDGILFDMYEITDIITTNDAAGYFMHSGYF